MAVKKIKEMRSNVDWSKDKERYILYADLMGFKERVRNTKHEDLKKKLTDFKAKLLNTFKPLQIGDHLKVVQYSDSILIVENDTTRDGFNRISKAAAKLMHIALSMELPLKGALAKGMLTFDEDNELYFGQPLIDAFLLHEEPYFYGIVAHHTIETDIEKWSGENPYIYTSVTMKGGRTAHHHLAYNLISTNLKSGTDITDNCHKWLNKIEGTVSGRPRIYIDNTRLILNSDSDLYQSLINPNNIDDNGKTGDSTSEKPIAQKVTFPIRPSWREKKFRKSRRVRITPEARHGS